MMSYYSHVIILSCFLAFDILLFGDTPALHYEEVLLAYYNSLFFFPLLLFVSINRSGFLLLATNNFSFLLIFVRQSAFCDATFK